MGTVIALPPIVNFGSPEIRDKVVPDVLAGCVLLSFRIGLIHHCYMYIS